MISSRDRSVDKWCLLLRVFPRKSTITFGSGLPWRLLISFYSVLHHFRGWISLFNTLGLLILCSPCWFCFVFSLLSLPPPPSGCSSFRKTHAQAVILDTIFLCTMGLSEMIVIISTCESSFSTALKGCSNLEVYLCLPRRDGVLIFFKNFGT